MTPAGNRRPGLVALGGSNTVVEGLASNSPDRWPDRVGRQLSIRVLNLGRSGLTIRDAYERGVVDRALKAGAPFVTVGFGVDDCLLLELGEFSGLLDRLLYEVETTGASPLLLTGLWLKYPPHLSADHWEEALSPFNQEIRSAASARGVRLLDAAARMERVVVDGTRGSQAVHQAAAGSRVMGHLVVQAIRSHEVPRRRTSARVSVPQ